ncbi:uncharacterized protein LOC125211359 isoform X1 [Salvia hispanica]|uniref:uncharacterized protein LOC125211359 isoform X1 n=1 Tax=Salvia hispanica TaxID=49212 RepID=UPI0020094F95|nr:uncharacterized protein LOC125211359 isoform X1 [Salvia hispanica]
MASPTREEIVNSDLEKQVLAMQVELEKLKIVKEEAEANMKSKKVELDRLYNKIKDESNAKVEEAKSNPKVEEAKSNNAKALSILKASLTSTSVLTDALLNSVPIKQPNTEKGEIKTGFKENSNKRVKQEV